MWVSPDEFSKKYPLEKLISSGAYGAVFSSGDYVVKVQGDLSSLQEGNEDKKLPNIGLNFESIRSYLVEIHFGKFLLHPNVMPLIAYSQSLDGLQRYLVYQKGEPIVSALIGKKITLEKTMTDLAKALYYINNMSVAHCDINPHNIIFYEGRACLIDFGLAREAKQQVDKEGFTDLFFKGIAYAAAFRDPSYNISGYNSVRVELFALARTLVTLSIYGEKTELFNNFISMSTVPLKNRHTINYICEKLNIAIELKWCFNVLDVKTPCDTKTISTVKPIFERVKKIFIKQRTSARTVFLGAHLFRYMCGTIENCAATEKERVYLYTLCCHVCCYTASLVTNFNELVDVQPWLIHDNGKFLIEEFFEMIVTLVYLCNGIIFMETPWDYAHSIKDLPTHLDDIFRESYAPNTIRKNKFVKNDESDCKDCSFTAMSQYSRSISPFVGSVCKLTIPSLVARY
jgi:serine/threonine protein kinase